MKQDKKQQEEQIGAQKMEESEAPDKKSEEVIHHQQQIICVDPKCSSMRTRILLISCSDNNSLLNLLCMDCGLLHNLTLGSGAKIEIIKSDLEKNQGAYLG